MVLQYKSRSREEVRKEVKGKAVARMTKILGVSFLYLGLTAGIKYYDGHRSSSLEQSLVSRINPNRKEPIVKNHKDLTEEVESLLAEIPRDFREYSYYSPYIMNLGRFPKEINAKIRIYNQLLSKKQDLEWSPKVMAYERWNKKRIDEFSQVLGSTSQFLANFSPYETLIILGSGLYGILKGRKEIKAFDFELSQDSIPITIDKN